QPRRPCCATTAAAIASIWPVATAPPTAIPPCPRWPPSAGPPLSTQTCAFGPSRAPTTGPSWTFARAPLGARARPRPCPRKRRWYGEGTPEVQGTGDGRLDRHRLGAAHPLSRRGLPAR